MKRGLSQKDVQKLRCLVEKMYRLADDFARCLSSLEVSEKTDRETAEAQSVYTLRLSMRALNAIHNALEDEEKSVSIGHLKKNLKAVAAQKGVGHKTMHEIKEALEDALG